MDCNDCNCKNSSKSVAFIGFFRWKSCAGEFLSCQLLFENCIISHFYQIPFEVVSSEPKPVVMCISPLFAAENWHNLLVSLHVYKIFGAHMHLYIRSIVSPMLEILRVYEQEGYATLKPWNRINLLNRDEQDFNPNLNVEFRSQAAAQTDCLLRYKVTIV